jgi:DNA-binding NarL/FixJ family response regulator
LDQRIISLNVLFNRADLLSAASLDSDAKAKAASAEAALNKQQAQIVHLARKGFTANQIAQKLSLPKGEVQLVLNLKRKLSESGGDES